MDANKREFPRLRRLTTEIRKGHGSVRAIRKCAELREGHFTLKGELGPPENLAEVSRGFRNLPRKRGRRNRRVRGPGLQRRSRLEGVQGCTAVTPLQINIHAGLMRVRAVTQPLQAGTEASQ